MSNNVNNRFNHLLNKFNTLAKSQADINKDGKIDDNEKAINEALLKFSESGNEMFNAIDDDGNITDYEKFMTGMLNLADEIGAKREIADKIKEWDVNGDGKITEDEIQDGDFSLLANDNIFKNGSNDDAFSIEDLLRYQELVDLNNDGKISNLEKNKFGSLVSSTREDYSNEAILNALQSAIKGTEADDTSKEIISKIKDGSIFPQGENTKEDVVLDKNGNAVSWKEVDSNGNLVRTVTNAAYDGNKNCVRFYETLTNGEKHLVENSYANNTLSGSRVTYLKDNGEISKKEFLDKDGNLQTLQDNYIYTGGILRGYDQRNGNKELLKECRNFQYDANGRAYEWDETVHSNGTATFQHQVLTYNKNGTVNERNIIRYDENDKMKEKFISFNEVSTAYQTNFVFDENNMVRGFEEYTPDQKTLTKTVSNCEYNDPQARITDWTETLPTGEVGKYKATYDAEGNKTVKLISQELKSGVYTTANDFMAKFDTDKSGEITETELKEAIANCKNSNELAMLEKLMNGENAILNPITADNISLFAKNGKITPQSLELFGIFAAAEKDSALANNLADKIKAFNNIATAADSFLTAKINDAAKAIGTDNFDAKATDLANALADFVAGLSGNDDVKITTEVKDGVWTQTYEFTDGPTVKVEFEGDDPPAFPPAIDFDKDNLELLINAKGNDEDSKVKVTIDSAPEDTNVKLDQNSSDLILDNKADNISISGRKDEGISGTDGDDIIFNSGKGVTIDGKGGNDQITNTGDDSTLIGNTGDDTFANTGKNVTIKGGAGDGDKFKLNKDGDKLADMDPQVLQGVEKLETLGEPITIKDGDKVSVKDNVITIESADGTSQKFRADGKEQTGEIVDGKMTYKLSVDGTEVTVTCKNDQPLAEEPTLVKNDDGSFKIVAKGLEDAPIDVMITKANEGANITVDSTNATIGNYADGITLNTGDGNDTILNDGKNVKINSGEGNDTIYNSAKATGNTINTGAGDDTVINEAANTEISTGEGNDKVANYGENVTVNTAAGDDIVVNEGKGSNINAGDGNDQIVNTAKDTQIDAGSDKDDFYLISENDDGTFSLNTLESQTLKGVESLKTLDKDITLTGDATVTVKDNVITVAEGNSTKTYDANGNLLTTIVDNNSSEAPNANGSKIDFAQQGQLQGFATLQLEKGDKATIQEDGTVILESGNVTKKYTPYGQLTSTIIDNNDSEYPNAAGGWVKFSDDKAIEIKDGEVATINADGTVTVTNEEEGTTVTYKPDGTQAFESSYTLEIDGAKVTVKTMDGSPLTSQPTITKDANGNFIINSNDEGVFVQIDSATTGKSVTINAKNANVVNNAEGITLNTGDGNDNITNNAKNVTINAGAGDDTITNKGTNAKIYGQDGNDNITNTGLGSSINGNDGSNDKFVLAMNNGNLVNITSPQLLNGIEKIVIGSKEVAIEDGSSIKVKNNIVTVIKDGKIVGTYKLDGPTIPAGELGSIEYLATATGLDFSAAEWDIKFDDATGRVTQITWSGATIGGELLQYDVTYNADGTVTVADKAGVETNGVAYTIGADGKLTQKVVTSPMGNTTTTTYENGEEATVIVDNNGNNMPNVNGNTIVFNSDDQYIALGKINTLTLNKGESAVINADGSVAFTSGNTTKLYSAKGVLLAVVTDNNNSELPNVADGVLKFVGTNTLNLNGLSVVINADGTVDITDLNLDHIVDKATTVTTYSKEGIKTKVTVSNASLGPNSIVKVTNFDEAGNVTSEVALDQSGNELFRMDNKTLKFADGKLVKLASLKEYGFDILGNIRLVSKDGLITNIDKTGKIRSYSAEPVISGKKVSYTIKVKYIEVTISHNVPGEGYFVNAPEVKIDENGNIILDAASTNGNIPMTVTINSAIATSGKTVTVNTTNGSTINNNAANITLNTGAGNDTINNTGAGVTINSGDGADNIHNTANDVTINSGDGDDNITSTGSVTIKAGKGDDTIDIDASSWYVEGNDGNDIVMSNVDASVTAPFEEEVVIKKATSTADGKIQFFNESGKVTEVRLPAGCKVQRAANDCISVVNAENKVIATYDKNGKLVSGTSTEFDTVTIDGKSYNIAGWNKLDSTTQAQVKALLKLNNIGSLGQNYFYFSVKTADAGNGMTKVTLTRTMSRQLQEVLYVNDAWIPQNIEGLMVGTEINNYSINYRQNNSTNSTKTENYNYKGTLQWDKTTEYNNKGEFQKTTENLYAENGKKYAETVTYTDKVVNKGFDAKGNVTYTVNNSNKSDYPSVKSWSDDGTAQLYFSSSKSITVSVGDVATINADGTVKVVAKDGTIKEFDKNGNQTMSLVNLFSILCNNKDLNSKTASELLKISDTGSQAGGGDSAFTVSKADLAAAFAKYDANSFEGKFIRMFFDGKNTTALFDKLAYIGHAWGSTSNSYLDFGELIDGSVGRTNATGNITIADLEKLVPPTLQNSYTLTIDGAKVTVKSADGKPLSEAPKISKDKNGNFIITAKDKGVKIVIESATAGKTVTVNATDANITNKAANITLNTGSGNDTITNTADYVTINSGSGNDTINNSGLHAVINGGDGNDTIKNTGAYANIKAGAGDDKINNKGAYSAIYGEAGKDKIVNTGANTLIDGGADSDTIYNAASGLRITSDKSDNVTNYTTLAQAKTAMTTAQTAYTTAQKNTATAQTNVNNAQKAYDTAKSNVDNAQTKVNNAQADVNKAQSEYDKANQAKVDYDAAQTAYNTANTNLTKAKTALTTANSKVVTAETAVKSADSIYQSYLKTYNTALSNYNTAKSAYDTAQAKYNNAQDAVNKAQAEYDKANQAKVDYDAAQKTYNTANSELTKAKSALTSANSKVTTAESKYKTAETAYQKALTNYNKKPTAANKKALETAEKNLSKAESNLQTAQKTAADAQAAYNTANSKFTAAKNDLAAKKTAYNNAKATISAKLTALNKAKSALTTAKSALTTAQNTLKSRETTLNTAKTNLNNSKNKLDTAKANLQTAQKTAADAQTAFNTANSKLTEAKTNLEAKKTAYNNARATIAAKLTALNKAKSALNTAKSALTTAQNTLKSRETTLNSYKKTLETRQATEAEKKAAYEKAKSIYDELNA